MDVLRAISSGKPPPPLPDSCPAPVGAVIMAALQPDPARRISSAQDLRRMLEATITTPVSPEEVARCLSHYVKPRIAARHAAIAEALQEAGARAAAAEPRSPDRSSELPAMRPTFPTLPPEAAAVSGVFLPGRLVAAAGRGPASAPLEVGLPPTTPSSDDAAPRLRGIHGIWLSVATLLMLMVWSAVVALAVQSQEDAHGGPHAGP